MKPPDVSNVTPDVKPSSQVLLVSDSYDIQGQLNSNVTSLGTCVQSIPARDSFNIQGQLNSNVTPTSNISVQSQSTPACNLEWPRRALDGFKLPPVITGESPSDRSDAQDHTIFDSSEFPRSNGTWTSPLPGKLLVEEGLMFLMVVMRLTLLSR